MITTMAMMKMAMMARRRKRRRRRRRRKKRTLHQQLQVRSEVLRGQADDHHFDKTWG